MAVHFGENKLVITTEPKTFYFDLYIEARNFILLQNIMNF